MIDCNEMKQAKGANGNMARTIVVGNGGIQFSSVSRDVFSKDATMLL